MITIKKLQSLKTGTRQRKIVSLLKGFETDCLDRFNSDTEFLIGIAHVSKDLESLDPGEKNRIASLVNQFESNKPSPLECDAIVRFCNSLRHILLRNMNSEPAEWDLIVPGDREAVSGQRDIMDFYLYLDDLRSPFNVGAIFRTAESFGVKEILLSEDTASPFHRRALRSAMGAVSIVPYRIVPASRLPDLPLFCLELGGTPLDSFTFPSGGILVVGSEEVGVSPYLLERTQRSLGRVSIPLGGLKGSLNVAVAAGIVLQRWYSTQSA